MIHKALVGKNYILGKSIYSLSNLYNGVDLVNNRGDIILIRDGAGDVLGRDAHVFIAIVECSKIDIFILVVINQAPGVDVRA